MPEQSSPNPSQTLSNLIGALVVHLIVVSSEKHWTSDRLDSEIVGGVRALCHRYRINVRTGDAVRNQTHRECRGRRERHYKISSWETRSGVTKFENELGGIRAVAVTAPMLSIQENNMPGNAQAVRVNGKWFLPARLDEHFRLDAEWASRR